MTFCEAIARVLVVVVDHGGDWVSSVTLSLTDSMPAVEVHRCL